MPRKKPIDLDLFRKTAKEHKRRMKRFLSKAEGFPTRRLQAITIEVEKQVWQEIDCLSCANCCKTMTPTFNLQDTKRIARFLGESVESFREKWLKKERSGDRDWINKKEPCQFLNLKDNKCSIYEVRPADCAGFPHLRKKLRDYVHVHKQNISHCPATYRFVELMMDQSPASFTAPAHI
ncbi:MAG: YkgJ family cysteine cluster protein [Chitinophagaceae bacterium]|nr:MAG: YkgJ family cysteine cluster protein [Chitinophagaceae bacterium]